MQTVYSNSGTELRKINPPVDYLKDINKMSSFLTKENIVFDKKVITVSLTSLYLEDPSLFRNIINNTDSYLQIVYKILNLVYYDEGYNNFQDENNVLMYHRISRLKEKWPDRNIVDTFPVELLRDYEVKFVFDTFYISELIQKQNNVKQESLYERLKNIIEQENTIIQNNNNNTLQSNNNNIMQSNNNNVLQSNNNNVLQNNLLNVRDNHKIQSTNNTHDTNNLHDSNNEGVYRRSLYDAIHNESHGSSLFYTITDLNSKLLGKYIITRGIVTKVGQIKPNLTIATYICEFCGSETYQETLNNDKFTLLADCNSIKCKSLKIRPLLVFQTRSSKFITMQRIIISEKTSDIQQGSTPRSISIYCYESLCGRLRPGNNVYVSGFLKNKENIYIRGMEFYDEEGNVFTPQNEHEETDKNTKSMDKLSGLNRISNLDAMGNSDTTTNIDGVNNLFHTNIDTHTNEQANDGPVSIDFFERLKREKFINLLIESFAPEIYGLTDIKKILILALIGSQTKEKKYMKIRGNINILLVGDPGTAKSQLLKTIHKISTGGCLTTGQGATGVGLTCALSKEHETGETILEAGALVLSDMGICCIDELDKMNENDRVSLHEVMEQQTVSISKAGINATLNARCGIIAASNPIQNSFVHKKSIEWNVGLPTSLISRFDCICIIKDKIDAENDQKLAEHITNGFLRNYNSQHDHNKVGRFGNKENNQNNECNKENIQSNDESNKENIVNRKVGKNKRKLNNKANKENRESSCSGQVIEPQESLYNTEDSISEQLLTVEEIKSYINKTKTFKPSLPNWLGKKLVNKYIEKRKEQDSLTPRYLLSLIRFSIAHARLRLSNTVEENDIEEAIRLLSENNDLLTERNKIKKNDKENLIYKTIINNLIEGKIKKDKLYNLLKDISTNEIDKIVNLYVDTGAMITENDNIHVIK